MFANERRQKITCTNCNGFGHSFRQCLAPVTSFGMILFRVKGGWNQAKMFLTNINAMTGLEGMEPSIEYLLIQRKDSLGFVEMMRGKYRLQDTEYIKQQLAGMTEEERKKLLTQSFDELWVGLWGETDQGNSYRSEKETSRTKLETLKAGYKKEGTEEVICLQDLHTAVPVRWETPEWGFPKGRRDPHESEFQCAMREAHEETGIMEKDILPIRNLLPIQESFFGSNGVHYCHKYYISHIAETVEVKMDTENLDMLREIGNIGWFSLDDALRMIRSDNIEKREILLKASSLLRNYSPLRLLP